LREPHALRIESFYYLKTQVVPFVEDSIPIVQDRLSLLLADSPSLYMPEQRRLRIALIAFNPFHSEAKEDERILGP